MFCDLVGSTQLSGQLDPEDLNEVLLQYQRAVTEEVNRLEGYVAKFLGDGMLILFGYPKAHEDDAVRAVTAALAMTLAVDSLRVPQLEAAGQKVSIRVGIHTGLVVAGEMGPDGKLSTDIVGETPNLAARVQGEAATGEVVITRETVRLLGDRFRIERMGQRALKGVGREVELFRVMGAVATAIKRKDQPLFGREQELLLIQERWTRSAQGKAQSVLLCGEAGIGKSGLVTHLRQHVGKARIIEMRCSVYQQSSAFHPIMELLEQSVLGLRREDDAATRISKMEAYLDQFGVNLPDTIPLLAGLLNTPVPDRYPPLALSAEGVRLKTLELLLHIVLRRALREPVLLIVEDLHWADPSTLRLLGMVIEQGTNVNLLTVVTYRPTFRPAFGMRPNVLVLNLDRLTRAASVDLIEATAGGPLPAEIIERILEKTDGVPLFLEELTKMVVESGVFSLVGHGGAPDGTVPDLAIPTTLHDSLMARLDRLSTVKEIAQFASVIGREFSSELLLKASGMDEDTFRREAAKLVEAELLDQYLDQEGQVAYRFRHVLIQDAAYKSLVRNRRQEYHGRIAETLQRSFPEIAENQPELVAGHFTRAAMASPAVQLWIVAGTRALARCAHFEAIDLFRRGLELVPGLTSPAEQVEREIALQASMGVALIATKGFSAPEVAATYSRAEALCSAVGDSPALFPVRWGIWVVRLVGAECAAALEPAQTLLRIATLSGDDSQLVEGHFTMGDTLMWLGDLAGAQHHLDLANEIYRTEKHTANAVLYGQDPGVAANCFLAIAHAYMFNHQKALEHGDRALEIAAKVCHPFSVSYALGCNTLVRLLLRDHEGACELGTRAVKDCTEQGHAFFSTSGVFMLGWGRYHNGEPEEGLRQMEEGLALFDVTGSRIAQAQFRALLAKAYVDQGRLVEAREQAERALAMSAEHAEAVSSPDAHLAMAKVLKAEGKPFRDLIRGGRALARLHGSLTRFDWVCKRAGFEEFLQELS
jgi:predicted ATPase/class 3 adenylate cyclase